MSKQIIKVYPDHLSTGLWNDFGGSVDAEPFKRLLGETSLLALKYWQEVWEFFIVNGDASNSYIERWNEDGKRLVELWNKKQDDFLFIYVEIYYV